MKDNLLNQLMNQSGVSIRSMLIILLVALVLGTYIFWIYKISSKAAFYDKDLNITLIGLCLIVAAIMIAMQSNLVVSLGMVGALSIVRFRTAIKSPIDLLYLFWAISIGIVCGVGQFLLAFLLNAVMTIVIVVYEKIPNSDKCCLMVIKGNTSFKEAEVYDKIKKVSRGYKEQAITITGEKKELIVQIDMKNFDVDFDDLYKINGVDSITCTRFSGNYRE